MNVGWRHFLIFAISILATFSEVSAQNAPVFVKPKRPLPVSTEATEPPKQSPFYDRVQLPAYYEDVNAFLSKPDVAAGRAPKDYVRLGMRAYDEGAYGDHFYDNVLKKEKTLGANYLSKFCAPLVEEMVNMFISDKFQLNRLNENDHERYNVGALAESTVRTPYEIGKASKAYQVNTPMTWNADINALFKQATASSNVLVEVLSGPSSQKVLKITSVTDLSKQKKGMSNLNNEYLFYLDPRDFSSLEAYKTSNAQDLLAALRKISQNSPQKQLFPLAAMHVRGTLHGNGGEGSVAHLATRMFSSQGPDKIFPAAFHNLAEKVAFENKSRFANHFAQLMDTTAKTLADEAVESTGRAAEIMARVEEINKSNAALAREARTALKGLDEEKNRLIFGRFILEHPECLPLVESYVTDLETKRRSVDASGWPWGYPQSIPPASAPKRVAVSPNHRQLAEEAKPVKEEEGTDKFYHEVLDGMVLRREAKVNPNNPDDNVLDIDGIKSIKKVGHSGEDSPVPVNPGWVKVEVDYTSEADEFGAKNSTAPKNSSIAEPFNRKEYFISEKNYDRYVAPYFNEKSGVRKISKENILENISISPEECKDLSFVTLKHDLNVGAIVPLKAMIDGKLIKYRVESLDTDEPKRRIYLDKECKDFKLVDRHMLEDYNELYRSEVVVKDKEGHELGKAGSYFVKEGNSFYNVADTNQILYPSHALDPASLKALRSLDVDVREKDIAELGAEHQGGTAPTGQEFIDATTKKSIRFKGPVDFQKVADGRGAYSWATKVRINGKDYYISNSYYNKYASEEAVDSEFSGSDVVGDDVLATPPVTEADGGHSTPGQRPSMGGVARVACSPASTANTQANCGVSGGSNRKYYRADPTDPKVNTYVSSIKNAANFNGLFKKTYGQDQTASFVSPDIIAAMLSIESNYKPNLENLPEKREAGGNENNRSHLSTWGKGIAQIGPAEATTLDLEWKGSYANNKSNPNHVFNPAVGIQGMGALLVTKMRALTGVVKSFNENSNRNTKYPKLDPNTVLNFLLNRAEYLGDKCKSDPVCVATSEAERVRYITSFYNRGMMSVYSVLNYYNRTGMFPSSYGEAWNEPPGLYHKNKKRQSIILRGQHINRGHIYRAAGLCGPMPDWSLVKKYGKVVGTK